MKGDIVELKADVVEMKGDITELKAGQNRMQGQLNNLIGTDYERQVARRAPRIVRRHLDLRQATVVYGINVPDGMSVRIQELLEQINPDQADDLERTDLILTGSTPAGQSTYAVAEVSRTIDEHDVDRAHRRSQILQRASGTICKAIVIGTAISDANRQRAAQDDVTVAIMVD